MKKNLLVLLILFNFGFVWAQNEFPMPKASDYPKSSRFGRTVESFIPKNYELVDKASGDLNADQTIDAVLIVKGTSQKFITAHEFLGENPFDTNPRVMIILFKDKANNRYRLAAQNNSFIKIPDYPTVSEPFVDVSVKNNVLKLDFEQWMSAGGWAATEASYKFRYQNGAFDLIGADKNYYMRNSDEGEIRSYNFLTNRVKIVTGNRFEESETGKRIKWKNYKVGKLKNFSSFKSPFSWEIERDYWL